MTGDVRLRYSREALRPQYRRMALSLLLIVPFGALKFVARHLGPFLIGVSFVLGIWVVTWTLLLLPWWGARYRVRGTTLLARGTRWARIDLAAVRSAGPILWHSPLEGDQASPKLECLVIELGDWQLRLGDTVHGTYFQPEGLRALADGLEQSPHPAVRGNAKWLRKIARHPHVGAWPLRPHRPPAA